MNAIKTYAGDSVYAEVSFANALVLTTENGTKATNRIIIEPETWRNILAFARDNWPYEHKRHQAELNAFIQDRYKQRRKHDPHWEDRKPSDYFEP